jgi:hypothetical protein
VADILEQELDPTIHEWIGLVEKEPDLIRIPLNFEERTGHLPRLLRDVIARLRLDKGSSPGFGAAVITESCDANKATAAMVVDESLNPAGLYFSTLHRKASCEIQQVASAW